MKPLLLAYIAFYAVASAWSIREDLRLGSPPWKSLLSTSGSALGIGGMWLFISGPIPPPIRSAWVLVFPTLVTLALIEAAYEYRYRLERLLPAADRKDPQIRSLVLVSMALGLALTLPCLWMNYRVAFGP